MSTTIDAAIIKALVEHVGGDSSCIGSGKTYTAGDGITISNDKICINYDTNTMKLTDDGKIANPLTTLGMHVEKDYSVDESDHFIIPAGWSGGFEIGAIIRTYYNNCDQTFIIVGEKITDLGYRNYIVISAIDPKVTSILTYDPDKNWFTCENIKHSGEITEKHGIFYPGYGLYDNPYGTEVVRATDYFIMIQYILSKLPSE